MLMSVTYIPVLLSTLIFSVALVHPLTTNVELSFTKLIDFINKLYADEKKKKQNNGPLEQQQKRSNFP